MTGAAPETGTMAGVVRGEAEADFDAVFLGSYPRLVRSLTVVCGDREVAADCVADAFERAYVRWRRVGRLEDPVGWVRRVAINRAVDQSRRRRRRDRAVERLAGSLDEAGQDRRDRPDDDVLALVSGLSPRQRAVVALHHLDDLPVAEVAAVMGISEGAVKYHLHEARARLRERMEVPGD